ncbi:methylated-DNA--[protein]-cysteine S-methyltransferase [Tenacibaculum agarivorans]|uniref:methylated-DNA--[protein]-cysteine S-methyltransferase n=1 Tax=Tenacibaculum agarivorans TaxID=1908389 RepID=UPI00094BB8F8|nr:methylated-DNA--[protein]-cysteine S-methyltransferase [Tenacibaculum agarivorans]
MSDVQTTYYKSPIGTLEIKGDNSYIHSIFFIDDDIINSEKISSVEIKKCVEQLDEYFSGTRKEFELNLSPKGTEFQGKVWNELLRVPFGKTRSYLEQSKKLGDVKAIRAVASANGKNPISIIIPCHRIIGSDGSLTGYAGGVWRKKWLLEHESESKQQTLF